MERLTEKITDKRTGEVLAYRAKCQKDVEAVQKLGRLEDLEEQGKLLELPCTVGDTVYRINKGAKEPIVTMKLCEVGIVSLKVGGFVMQIMCRDELDNGETHYLSTDFGKTVFITREESESALKELKSKETGK